MRLLITYRQPHIKATRIRCLSSSRQILTYHLVLVVAEEDLDGEPAVTADLEAVGQAAKLLHLVVGEAPAVKLVVGLYPGSGNGLGNDRGTALETPHEAGGKGSVSS